MSTLSKITFLKASLDSELERVGCGFGITAKDHFNNLRKLITGLRGLAILDNDRRNRKVFDDQSFCIRYWNRYEVENYFITPSLLLAYVANMNLGLGLFLAGFPTGGRRAEWTD